MQIQVNGEARELPAGATVETLVGTLDLAGRRVAIEVNEVLVPRSAYGARPLADGDRVEIVHAIGGG